MSLTAIEKNISQEVTAWIRRNIQSSPTVRQVTESAFSEFQQTGLPPNKTEEFRHTPLTRVLEKSFDFTTDTKSSEIDPSPFFIKGIEANVLVFVNGVFSAKHSKIISPESDISILSLDRALSEKPEVIGLHFNKYIDQKADSLAAWNTAAWKDGVFIHVPDNKVLETPILIYHVNDTSNGQVIAINRNLFVVGRNSVVTVIEKFDSYGPGSCFVNIVTEGFVDENGGLNFYSIQRDSASHYNLKQIHQSDSSRVNTYTFTLDGKLVRNNLHLSLDGERIESHMYGLYLLKGDTLADNHTAVDHKKPNSFSNELYKGIMDENSKGVFNGKIYVRPNAQKTNAFQANKNILLTNSATVNTKPQLEIWADDVKCSHGCTTGQLDEEALFYLQSRGIQKEAARAMMLYAFAGDVLQNVQLPVIKEYLEEIIRERFTKEF